MVEYVSFLDGHSIAYTDQTEFLVQVGKGKGSYSTTYRVVGKLSQAVRLYVGINIGKGHKKRLMMPSCGKRPCLARHFSSKGGDVWASVGLWATKGRG